jgi:small subunit ribosomal protein S1
VVTEVDTGGVEVTVGGMRAFCPISQLSDRYVEDPAEFVDRRLEFRVEKYQESGRRTNVVLSRRALLEEENRRRADELRERLEVGAVFPGTVTSVTSYGAFVDLGGLEGLLHVSEMSHQRVDDPHEVLAEGQRIEVQVIRLEPGKKPGESERISLSTRVLQRDPWKELERSFPVGTEFEGRVTRLEPYGAFVELVPGVEGLVHVSKLGVEEHVRHAREVLELGQQVRVEVLAVDPEKRRISLARKPGDPGAQLRDEVDRYVDTAPRSGGLGSLEHAFKKSREE